MTNTEIQEMILDDNAFYVELLNGVKEEYTLSLALEYVNKKHKKKFKDIDIFDSVGEGDVSSDVINKDGTVTIECNLYNLEYTVNGVTHTVDHNGIKIKAICQPYIDSDGCGILKLISSEII